METTAAALTSSVEARMISKNRLSDGDNFCRFLREDKKVSFFWMDLSCLEADFTSFSVLLVLLL